ELRQRGVQRRRRADRLAADAGDDRAGRHPGVRGRAGADRADDQGAGAHLGDRVRHGQVGVVGVAALALPVPGGAVTAEAVTAAEAAEAVVVLLLLLLGLLLRVAAGALADVYPDERRVADRDGRAGVTRGDLPGHRQGGVDRDGEAGRRLLVGEAHVLAGRVHADDLAGRIDQRAARVAGHDARVGLEHPVQRLRGDRAALVAGRDGLVDPGDAPGRGDDLAAALGVAQGGHRVAHLDLAGIAERDLVQAGRVLQLDQRDVAGHVVPHDPGLEVLPGGGHRRADLGGVLDDLVVGQHQALVRVDPHAGARGPLAAVLQRGVDDDAALSDLGQAAARRTVPSATRLGHG